MSLFNESVFGEVLPGTTDTGSASTGVSVKGTDIPVVNSNTYIDNVGVLLGIERSPGETSQEFLERVIRAGSSSRTSNYEGLMNELGLQFGLFLQPCIQLAGNPAILVNVDIAGVHLKWNQGQSSLHISLMTVGPDNFWEWKSLSDIVAAINGTNVLTAVLLTADGPAFQLVTQSNTQLAVGEDITGQTANLENATLIAGTEQFNQPVPSYTIQGQSILYFSAALPPGTKITYQYMIQPYTLLMSPIFMMNLADPLLGAVALGPNNKLVYQVKEYVQELVSKDLSYWAD